MSDPIELAFANTILLNISQSVDRLITKCSGSSDLSFHYNFANTEFRNINNGLAKKYILELIDRKYLQEPIYFNISFSQNHSLTITVKRQNHLDIVTTVVQ